MSSASTVIVHLGNNGSRSEAMRDGPWKLIRVDNYGLALYNLDADISETKNVASDHPEVVEHLMQDLTFARQEIGSHNQIGINSRRRK